MTAIIFMKLVILAACWVAGWTFYFGSRNMPVNPINLSIALAPFWLLVMWFMLFVW